MKNHSPFKIEYNQELNRTTVDGEIMDIDLHKKLTGITSDILHTSDWMVVVIDNNIYTKDFKLVTMIDLIGRTEYPSQSSGPQDSRELTEQGGKSFSRNHLLNISDYVISPWEQFYEDYPDFNKSEYIRLKNAFNTYVKEKPIREKLRSI